MTADPAAGVGIAAAFAAGFVSFLSPCVLPLVPGYLSAVSGVNVASLGERGNRWKVLLPSLLFIATFTAIFVALGVSAFAVGQTLRRHMDLLTDLAGVLMILMGLLFVLVPLVPRLGKEWHVEGLLARAGKGGPVVAGAAFAIAWTPCIGPTLGAILSAAAVSASAPRAAGLLLVYSAGLGLPFLLTGIAFSKATRTFAFVRRHYGVVIAIGGLILIAMGILVLTGEVTRLNIELQRWADELGLAI